MLSEPLYRWILYVGVGTVLLLAIVFAPKRVKLFVGRFVRPNWMSVVHAPMAWVAYFWLYQEGHHFWAIMLMSLSGGLDLADGRVARAYDELVGKPLADGASYWTQMNHRGTTPLGKVLDPLADKVTVAPIFIHICWVFWTEAGHTKDASVLGLLYFGVAQIILMLLVDFIGQLIRLDYFKRWRPEEKKDDKSATLPGKIKTLVQWEWLPLYAIWHQGWLPDLICLIVLNAFLLGVLTLTIASALSKMRPLPELFEEGFSVG